MTNLKKCVIGLIGALIVAAAGPGSALAVSWNPVGINVGPLTGVVTLTTSAGGSVTCDYRSFVLVARTSTNIANTTNSAGSFAPPTWSNCRNSISSGLSTSMSSSVAWNYFAINTTSADANSINMVAVIGGGVCTVTVSGVAIRANTWNNSQHSLTFNSSTSFATSESGLCDGGTRGRLSGTIFDTSRVLTIV